MANATYTKIFKCFIVFQVSFLPYGSQFRFAGNGYHLRALNSMTESKSLSDSSDGLNRHNYYHVSVLSYIFKIFEKIFQLIILIILIADFSRFSLNLKKVIYDPNT